MVPETPVRLIRSRLMTMFKTQSATESASVQPDWPVPLLPDNISAGGDSRDGVHAERIWDLQDLSDQSAGGVLALQQMQ